MFQNTSHCPRLRSCSCDNSLLVDFPGRLPGSSCHCGRNRWQTEEQSLRGDLQSTLFFFLSLCLHICIGLCCLSQHLVFFNRFFSLSSRPLTSFLFFICQQWLNVNWNSGPAPLKDADHSQQLSNWEALLCLLASSSLQRDQDFKKYTSPYQQLKDSTQSCFLFWFVFCFFRSTWTNKHWHVVGLVDWPFSRTTR